MPDIGERYTDEALIRLRRRLSSIYMEAKRDVAMKLSSFEHAHRERVKKHLREVREGVITKDDYRAWMRGQVFQREQWLKKQQQIAEIMTHVDEQAMAMLNEGRVDVFAENANFMGWDLESGAGVDFGFGLMNAEAVERIILEEPDMLPRPKIDKAKDYAWYNQIVSDAVTQGILQGEALDEIMLRIANDTGERSINAMLRNARTAYTGAQNAGREMAMRRVKAKGIRIHKQWSAFMDAITRDAHAELNGKHVDPDEPFESMLGKIMRPGDPKAKPANVYNCRCCLKKYFLDYPDSSGERGGNGEDTDENREAYERWKALKKDAGKAAAQDIRKQLKKRAEEKKKAQTPAEDPLAGATWANGPRAGQKYGEKAEPQRAHAARFKSAKNPSLTSGNNGSTISNSSNRVAINLQLFAAPRDPSKYKTIWLPKAEYAHVMSELNTHMSVAERKRKIVTKAVGNYIYTFENHGFDNYRIFMKEPINPDIIDEVDS